MSRGKMTADGFCWDGKVVAPYHFVLLNYSQVCDVNGENSKHYYTLSAEIGQENFTESITVSSFANLVGSAHWEQCVDADLSSKNKKILVADLQEQLAEWKEPICIVEFDEPGLYNIDGKYVYLRKDGVIIQSPDDHRLYRFTRAHQKPKVAGCMEWEQTQNYLDRLLSFYPGVTDVLVLYVVLAHMKPIYALLEIPVDVILAMTGSSGSFKTTLAKIVVPEPARFKFLTVRASQLEKQLLFHTGSCVLVDDYKNAKQKHVRDRLADIFDVLSRIADSRKNAMAITTGEFLEGDFSFQDRLYQVFLQKSRKNYVSSELNSLSWISSNERIFQDFLNNFDEQLYRDVPRIITIIEQNRACLQKRNTGFRIDRNIGLLEIALEVLCELYPEGVFCQKKDSILCSLQTLYKNQVTRMQKIQILNEDADWALIFFQAYDHCSFPEKLSYTPELQHFVQNRCLYITRMSMEIGISNWLKCVSSTDVVVQDLNNKQMLVTDNSKDLTVKYKNGLRYYRIDIGKLQRYCEIKQAGR